MAGPKPRDKGRLGWSSDPAGCNASEVRAGLERVDADADPSFAWGRPRGQGRNRHMHLFGLPGYWTQHVGMVMRVIGGDPSRSKVAASTSLMAVDRAGEYRYHSCKFGRRPAYAGLLMVGPVTVGNHWLNATVRLDTKNCL